LFENQKFMSIIVWFFQSGRKGKKFEREKGKIVCLF